MPKLRIKNNLTIDANTTSSERSSRLNKKNVINLENLATFAARLMSDDVGVFGSPVSYFSNDLQFVGVKADLLNNLNIEEINIDDNFLLYSDTNKLIGIYNVVSEGTVLGIILRPIGKFSRDNISAMYNDATSNGNPSIVSKNFKILIINSTSGILGSNINKILDEKFDNLSTFPSFKSTTGKILQNFNDHFSESPFTHNNNKNFSIRRHNIKDNSNPNNLTEAKNLIFPKDDLDLDLNSVSFSSISEQYNSNFGEETNVENLNYISLPNTFITPIQKIGTIDQNTLGEQIVGKLDNLSNNIVNKDLFELEYTPYSEDRNTLDIVDNDFFNETIDEEIKSGYSLGAQKEIQIELDFTESVDAHLVNTTQRFDRQRPANVRNVNGGIAGRSVVDDAIYVDQFSFIQGEGGHVSSHFITNSYWNFEEKRWEYNVVPYDNNNNISFHLGGFTNRIDDSGTETLSNSLMGTQSIRERFRFYNHETEFIIPPLVFPAGVPVKDGIDTINDVFQFNPVCFTPSFRGDNSFLKLNNNSNNNKNAILLPTDSYGFPNNLLWQPNNSHLLKMENYLANNFLVEKIIVEGKLTSLGEFPSSPGNFSSVSAANFDLRNTNIGGNLADYDWSNQTGESGLLSGYYDEYGLKKYNRNNSYISNNITFYILNQKSNIDVLKENTPFNFLNYSFPNQLSSEIKNDNSKYSQDSNSLKGNLKRLVTQHTGSDASDGHLYTYDNFSSDSFVYSTDKFGRVEYFKNENSNINTKVGFYYLDKNVHPSGGATTRSNTNNVLRYYLLENETYKSKYDSNDFDWLNFDVDTTDNNLFGGIVGGFRAKYRNASLQEKDSSSRELVTYNNILLVGNGTPDLSSTPNISNFKSSIDQNILKNIDLILPVDNDSSSTQPHLNISNPTSFKITSKIRNVGPKSISFKDASLFRIKSNYIPEDIVELEILETISGNDEFSIGFGSSLSGIFDIGFIIDNSINTRSSPGNLITKNFIGGKVIIGSLGLNFNQLVQLISDTINARYDQPLPGTATLSTIKSEIVSENKIIIINGNGSVTTPDSIIHTVYNDLSTFGTDAYKSLEPFDNELLIYEGRNNGQSNLLGTLSNRKINTENTSNFKDIKYYSLENGKKVDNIDNIINCTYLLKPEDELIFGINSYANGEEVASMIRLHDKLKITLIGRDYIKSDTPRIQNNLNIRKVLYTGISNDRIDESSASYTSKFKLLNKKRNKTINIDKSLEEFKNNEVILEKHKETQTGIISFESNIDNSKFKKNGKLFKSLYLLDSFFQDPIDLFENTFNKTKTETNELDGFNAQNTKYVIAGNKNSINYFENLFDNSIQNLLSGTNPFNTSLDDTSIASELAGFKSKVLFELPKKFINAIFNNSNKRFDNIKNSINVIELNYLYYDTISYFAGLTNASSNKSQKQLMIDISTIDPASTPANTTTSTFPLNSSIAVNILNNGEKTRLENILIQESLGTIRSSLLPKQIMSFNDDRHLVLEDYKPYVRSSHKIQNGLFIDSNNFISLDTSDVISSLGGSELVDQFRRNQLAGLINEHIEVDQPNWSIQMIKVPSLFLNKSDTHFIDDEMYLDQGVYNIDRSTCVRENVEIADGSQINKKFFEKDINIFSSHSAMQTDVGGRPWWCLVLEYDVTTINREDAPSSTKESVFYDIYRKIKEGVLESENIGNKQHNYFRSKDMTTLLIRKVLTENLTNAIHQTNQWAVKDAIVYLDENPASTRKIMHLVIPLSITEVLHLNIEDIVAESANPNTESSIDVRFDHNTRGLTFGFHTLALPWYSRDLNSDASPIRTTKFDQYFYFQGDSDWNLVYNPVDESDSVTRKNQWVSQALGNSDNVPFTMIGSLPLKIDDFSFLANKLLVEGDLFDGFRTEGDVNQLPSSNDFANALNILIGNTYFIDIKYPRFKYENNSVQNLLPLYQRKEEDYELLPNTKDIQLNESNINLINLKLFENNYDDARLQIRNKYSKVKENYSYFNNEYIYKSPIFFVKHDNLLEKTSYDLVFKYENPHKYNQGLLTGTEDQFLRRFIDVIGIVNKNSIFNTKGVYEESQLFASSFIDINDFFNNVLKSRISFTQSEGIKSYFNNSKNIKLKFRVFENNRYSNKDFLNLDVNSDVPYFEFDLAESSLRFKYCHLQGFNEVENKVENDLPYILPDFLQPFSTSLEYKRSSYILDALAKITSGTGVGNIESTYTNSNLGLVGDFKTRYFGAPIFNLNTVDDYNSFKEKNAAIKNFLYGFDNTSNDALPLNKIKGFKYGIQNGSLRSLKFNFNNKSYGQISDRINGFTDYSTILIDNSNTSQFNFIVEKKFVDENYKFINSTNFVGTSPTSFNTDIYARVTYPYIEESEDTTAGEFKNSLIINAEE